MATKTYTPKELRQRATMAYRRAQSIARKLHNCEEERDVTKLMLREVIELVSTLDRRRAWGLAEACERLSDPVFRLEYLTRKGARSPLVSVVELGEGAPPAPALDLTIRGWWCPCDIFNGEEAGRRTECRSCGKPKPAHGAR